MTPPTQTTSRYRGKYDGCYSYDGLIVKGVSDVRIELYINLKHRTPVGDPISNLFQSQDPRFTKNIGMFRPVSGTYCRSDQTDRALLPCTVCGLTTEYGTCPSLDEIGLSASEAIYNELATQSPSKINVWYVSSEEAYFKTEGLTKNSRMAQAKLTLATSYRGAALLANMFRGSTSTFNLTLQVNHTHLNEYVPRKYAVQFEMSFGAFTSRGPWEDYKIDSTELLQQGKELASVSGMWRAVMVDGYKPHRVQDSRLSVSEQCDLDPKTPGDESNNWNECVKNWTGSNPGATYNQTFDVGTETEPNWYHGLWRDKETLATVEITDMMPSAATTLGAKTYRIRTRASEGVFITGHFYVWIGTLGAVPADNNGVVYDSKCKVSASATALEMQQLLIDAAIEAGMTLSSLTVVRAK